MVDKPTMGERYYTQVTESINSILELATRVDERVQIMMKKQQELELKIDSQADAFITLRNKFEILESHNGPLFHEEVRKMADEIRRLELKASAIESSTSTQEGRWNKIITFTVQLIWVVLAAFVLYNMGISAPNIP